MKPIHGQPKETNLPEDALDVSPFPCDFKKGDKIIYTNDYGVEFELEVRGFAPVKDYDRFVYIFTDCWWFPEDPKRMRLR